MIDIDHIDIRLLTPGTTILEELGSRLARVRRRQGWSQARLAGQAGLGVATLRRMEDGRDAQLGSWIKVLKALDMVASIDALLPESFRSPMEDVLGEAKRVRRRSAGSSGDAPGEPFRWGDEAP